MATLSRLAASIVRTKSLPKVSGQTGNSFAVAICVRAPAPAAANASSCTLSSSGGFLKGSSGGRFLGCGRKLNRPGSVGGAQNARLESSPSMVPW